MNPNPTFGSLDSASLYRSNAGEANSHLEVLGWRGGAAAKPIVRHEVQTRALKFPPNPFLTDKLSDQTW